MDKLNLPPLRLKQKHQQELIILADEGKPEEICGIIIGEHQTSLEIISITNIAPTPHSNFQMAPEEILTTFTTIDEQNLNLLAFFHSHPHSAPIPSPTDLAQAYYPDTPMIIIGKPNNHWQLRAYYLNKDTYKETKIELLP